MRRREFFKTTLGAAAALGVPSLVPRRSSAPMRRAIGSTWASSDWATRARSTCRHSSGTTTSRCWPSATSTRPATATTTQSSSSGASRARRRSTPTTPRRRAAGQYKGCDAYNDFREVLGPQGHRRRGARRARPLARPDDRDGRRGRQGHLLREAAVAHRRARARRWSRPCASTSGSCRPAATTAPARRTASPANWCATGGSARSSGS